MKIAGYEVHPAAELFPLLSDADLAKLADDIRAHGLHHAIVCHEDKVLDGRNRLAACAKAGVAPRFERWTGSGSPVSWVLSENLHRRHLDESQRAMVAARAKPMFEAEARDRERAGTLAPIGATGKSSEKAAEALNVSPRAVERASKVLKSGAPELVEKVERGEVAVSTAAVVAEASKEEQREIVARGEKAILEAAKEIRSKRLEERRQERMENLAAISAGSTPLESSVGVFPIVYADPPWRYEHVEAESRAIENQYPTMELDAICAMPLADVTTPDAVLFLWATSPKLAEAMRVIEAWGFTYRTSMVWVKDKIGMGYYARQRHELLLIATKGAPPTPAPSDRPDSVVNAARGKHSAKPDEFAALIERMYPSLPKLELFCRSPREGWSVWGNQAA